MIQANRQLLKATDVLSTVEISNAWRRRQKINRARLERIVFAATRPVRAAATVN